MSAAQAKMPWGATVGERDWFSTHPRAVEALLTHKPPPRGVPVLDPCAGEGALLQVLVEMGWTDVYGVEVRSEPVRRLQEVYGFDRVRCADWYDVAGKNQYAETPIICNPPFSELPRFSESCFWSPRPYIALLLPVEELAGTSRARWFANHRPTGMVALSWRPFAGSRGLAWFVYEQGRPALDIAIV
jgi:hypothetical protein